MSGKIEISRELAERVLAKLEQADYSWNVNYPEQELRALLATPVVERQQPIAYMRNEGTPNNLVKCTFICDGAFGVYREPPEPVAVPVEIHQMLIEMRQQFERANFVALGKLLTACLDKVKELNQ